MTPEPWRWPFGQVSLIAGKGRIFSACGVDRGLWGRSLLCKRQRTPGKQANNGGVQIERSTWSP